VDEEIFRALADPSRRALLDALREQDGQALSELEAALPGMTRFGVMKHLRVLADASLITTRRDGRRKLHFLNAVPIRLIYDRWVSKYTEPWAAALTGLKRTLEEPMEKVYEIYIKTTPERLWQAITDSEIRSKYHFGNAIRSDWTPGSRFEMGHRGFDGLLGEGENLEVDPPRRLVQSMRALWDEEVKEEGFSRVTWEIAEETAGIARLTVTHELEGAPKHAAQVASTAPIEQGGGGWLWILSDLKTLVESGTI